MTNQRVADRYAKSLLDLAVDRAQLDVIKADVDALLDMADNRELAMVLQSPVIKPSKKQSIFAELLDKAGANELTKTFVKVLIGKGRESDLVGILGAFNNQYKRMKNISSVKVTSAVALSDQEITAIKQQLVAGGMTEADIDVETAVDPALMGGFVLEFDGKVYDASVAHKLHEIRKELVK